MYSNVEVLMIFFNHHDFVWVKFYTRCCGQYTIWAIYISHVKLLIENGQIYKMTIYENWHAHNHCSQILSKNYTLMIQKSLCSLNLTQCDFSPYQDWKYKHQRTMFCYCSRQEIQKSWESSRLPQKFMMNKDIIILLNIMPTDLL